MYSIGLFVLVLQCSYWQTASAQDPKPAAKPLVREIFVPFEDLSLILENDAQRVFLTSKEYAELIAKAQQSTEVKAPHSVGVIAAAYDGKLEEGRASIEGTLEIELWNDGLQAIPLDLAGVGIRSALLDGKPASLGRNVAGQVILFAEEKGKHTLALALTTLLQTSAATQTLQVTLPTPAATKLQLTVPGNVEVKAGAAVIRREYNAQDVFTRLELIPARGPLAVVMSFNNKKLQDKRVVVAKSVLVTEVTQGYERIHANVSHRVLHGAVDKFRFEVPAGFEVTGVESPLLSRWEMKNEKQGETERSVLEAVLREPTTESVVLEISASRSPPQFEKWTLPRLIPLDVAGQVAVVALLVEDRLQAAAIVPEGLLPIDAAVLATAIPATVFKAEPGAPTLRQVVSYYAPAGEYRLSAEITRPAVENRVASSALLTISDKLLRVSGQFILAPEAENLFEFNFSSPAGWHVTTVTKDDGTALPVERYPLANGTTRQHVRLPGGVKAGERLGIRFQALSTPSGWLGNWSSQGVAFPQFLVDGATRDSGAVGVAIEDDLTVRPEQLDGLTSLSDDEQRALTGGTQALALAYRFESRPFTAGLVVDRILSSMTADLFSFFTLEPDNLKAHCELHYNVRDARTRELHFSLPASTPAEVTTVGLGNVVVKETSSLVVGDRRQWLVQLAERQSGEIRLAVSFEQRYEQKEPQGLVLPLLTAEGVEHQSVLVGVEGSAELDLNVATKARVVDVGEVQGDVAYTVSRRLVGAYGYVGTQSEIKVDVLRRKSYILPAALIQRAELVTRVSQGGRSQSVARYDLKTKATLLEIRLPPESELWTIFLDGEPTKPQKQDGSLLLTLPAQAKSVARRLQIVYEATDAQGASGQHSIGLTGKVQAIAPQLLLRLEGEASAGEIPQANLVWTLILPTGYQVRRAGGSVFTEEIPVHELAAWKTLRWVTELAQTNPWPDGAKSATSLRSTSDDSAPSSMDGSVYARRTQDPHSRMSTEESSFPFMDSFKSRQSEPMAADESALQKVAAAKDALPPAPQSKPLLSAAAAAKPAEQPMAEPSADKSGEDKTVEMLKMQGTPRSIVQEEENENLGISVEEGQPASTKQSERKYWAEQGLSSLVIDVQNDLYAPAVTFQSLGVLPELQAQIVDQRWLAWVARGVFLLVLLVGCGLIRKTLRQKVGFVLVTMLVATLPLLLTDRLDHLAAIGDSTFYAAALLFPIYLVAAVAQAGCKSLGCCFTGACEMNSTNATTSAGNSLPFGSISSSAVLLLLSTVWSIGAPVALAQVPIDIKNFKELLPFLDPGGPVNIPRDAVIIPYAADQEDGLKKAEKVLVPYEKYVELWNLANPDKKLQRVAPPADYAFAGVTYHATLADSEDLLLTGRLQIDLYIDKPTVIPLNLVRGVLVKALLDGQPARLQIVQPEQVPASAQQQKAAPPAGVEAVALLHVAGQGRKQLELSIRLGLERRGGWRIASGRLPVAPAAALNLTIPNAQTEVRLTGLPDKDSFESTKANYQVQTALGADGSLAVQWRPKVAEGLVDQALTAASTGVIDIREDAVRLVWQVKLDFGRTSRDSFKLSVPADYLVEQVTGENIRGWQTKAENGRQSLDITLLKSAVGSETLTVYISRRGSIGQGELAQFVAPDLRVDSVLLHQGDLAIRRSDRIDLRSMSVAELSRADAEGKTAGVEQLADSAEATVLLLRPFQSYRFVREGYQLTLAAAKLSQESSAQVRLIVRAGQRETSLDAAIVYRVKGEPLYRARMYLPAGLEIEKLAPDELEWALTTVPVNVAGKIENRQLLTVHLPQGVSSEFTLTLLGRLGKRANPAELLAPKLEVLDAQQQTGDLVILPEPDTDVEATELTGLERIPSMEILGWLQPNQRALAKLALRYPDAAYAATLKLTPRTPQISAVSVTNVRVTPKAIEESLFFRFQVTDAGVRELTVLVPQYLEKTRLPEELRSTVQQKIVEPALGADGKPLAGMVQIRFVLPEYRTGRIDLGLTYDRLLTDEQQVAAIPHFQNVRNAKRFVVLENSGRDELVVEKVASLEQISSGQKVTEELQAILGDSCNLTQAYVVQDQTQPPSLSFQTNRRDLAQTGQTSIGLSETFLVLDASGAYRGEVQLQVKNEGGQFLEIEFPLGARLWTAIVAGEPIKPVEDANPKPGHVKIPLVKSAQGEGDYPVVLKYGGAMKNLSQLSQVSFPLVQIVGVKVQLSQVRLHLPQSLHWLDFGGKLKQVLSSRELEQNFQSYLNQELEEATRQLTRGDDFTKVRAANNLKKLDYVYRDNKSRQQGQEELSNQALLNEKLLASGIQQAEQQLQQNDEVDRSDNRRNLNSLWYKQERKRSKDVVGNLVSNFTAPSVATKENAPNPAAQGFNGSFFAQNSLSGRGTADGKSDAKGESAVPQQPTNSRVAVGRKASQNSAEPIGNLRGDEKGKQSQLQQLQLNDLSDSGAANSGEKNSQLHSQLDVTKAMPQPQEQKKSLAQQQTMGREESRKGQAETLRRYQEKLETQNDAELSYQSQGRSRFGSSSNSNSGPSLVSKNANPNDSRAASDADMPVVPRYRSPNASGGSLPPGMGGPSNGPSDRDMRGMGMGGGGGFGLGMPTAEGLAGPTGLASLDVELPLDGEAYYFTTLQGDLKITARPVSKNFLQRLQSAGWVLMALLAFYLLTRPRVVAFFQVTAAAPLFPLLLVLLGLASLGLNRFPLAGLGLLVIGTYLLVTRWVISRLKRLPAQA